MNTAFIVGIDSAIGRSLENLLILNGWSVFGTSRRSSHTKSNVFYLDLANVTDLNFDIPIDVVYLCAGVTKIAQCKENSAYSKLINVDAQIQLAAYFLNKNTHVVCLSSNAVFSGHKPWYQTTDKTCPKTYYGENKALVEDALLGMSKHIAIVRLTKVLTPDYPLILQWIMALKNNLPVEPFNDLSLCPISIYTVAQCLKEIGDKKLEGIIHLSGSIDVTYLDVAEYLAKLINARKGLIKEISMLCSNEIMMDASLYTSLDITKSKQLFDVFDTSFATTMNCLYGDFNR